MIIFRWINTIFCHIPVPHTHFSLTYSSKPLVCLFPALFKQNLLSFIYLAPSALPRTAVLHLLECLGQDPRPSPWVAALARQLERNLGAHSEEPLYTPLCSQRLKELSQRLVGFGEAGGWAKCLSGQTEASESQSVSGSSEMGTRRKRKGRFVTLDSDGEETGRQSKRIKMDVCGSERLDAEEESAREEMSERLDGEAPAETPAEDLKTAADSPCDALPEHIKVETLKGSTGFICPVYTEMFHHSCFHNFSVLISFHWRAEFFKWWSQLKFPHMLYFSVYSGRRSSNKRIAGKSDRGKKKHFLSCNQHYWHRLRVTFGVTLIIIIIIIIVCLQWDQSSTDVFKVLNECDPGQVCPQRFLALPFCMF